MGGRTEERESDGRGSTEEGVCCWGGGDGIDQIKYFTTHFRRCARRVARGRVVRPNQETERQQKKSVVQFCATENSAHAFSPLNMDFRMCISFPEISGFIIDKGVLEF